MISVNRQQSANNLQNGQSVVYTYNIVHDCPKPGNYNEISVKSQSHSAGEIFDFLYEIKNYSEISTYMPF